MMYAAFLDEGQIVLMIPIVAILIGGLTTVLKLMTNHQRQMAELYQKNALQPELLDEVKALRIELAEMKDRINQQTLLLDGRTPAQAGTIGLQDRITER